MSVTLTSRPEPPRSVRSRATRSPTAVRGSAANQADSWVRGYDAHRPRRVRRRAVVGGPVLAPVRGAAQVAHGPRDQGAGRRGEDVLVVLGRAAVGRVVEGVRDRRPALQHEPGGRDDRRARRRLLAGRAAIHLGPAVVDDVVVGHARPESPGGVGARGDGLRLERGRRPGDGHLGRDHAAEVQVERDVVHDADHGLGGRGAEAQDPAIGVVAAGLGPELQAAVGTAGTDEHLAPARPRSAGRRRRPNRPGSARPSARRRP